MQQRRRWFAHERECSELDDKSGQIRMAVAIFGDTNLTWQNARAQSKSHSDVITTLAVDVFSSTETIPSAARSFRERKAKKSASFCRLGVRILTRVGVRYVGDIQILHGRLALPCFI